MRAWREAHPDGEVVPHDTAPTAISLLQELSSPSLFAPARLLSVRDASAFVSSRKDAKSKEGELLARGLAKLRLGGDLLLLSAVCASPPSGELPDLVRREGELRYLPLPEPPKPWEEVRVSPAQREVLAEVVRRVAPEVLRERDAFDALCSAYGFRPRELAQAAQRLVLGGEITAEAARLQSGAGECTPKDLEEALLTRDRARLTRWVVALDGGASLVSWRGDAIEPDRLGAFLVPFVGRLLRQALAAREHTTRVGLAKELDQRQCSRPGWYSRVFKTTVLPRLEKEIAANGGSPVADLSAWQLHRIFRLAAAHTSAELLRALEGLTASNAERTRGRASLTALTPVLMGLLEPSPGSAGHRAHGG